MKCKFYNQVEAPEEMPDVVMPDIDEGEIDEEEEKLEE